MRSRALTTVSILLVATALVACTGSGGSASPSAAGSTAASSSASASEAASPSAAATAASTATVEAKPVGSLGTVLVDGASGKTVYVFAKDVKDSGKSNCIGGCLNTWPALTVSAGQTPTGGNGVTGTLGTITRADDGTLQVTYNGLPLYFFSGDSAAGDANGVYTNWSAVKP